MLGIEKKALELIEPIYAAATDRRQWPQLIGTISNAVGGEGGMLRLTDYSNRKVGFFETVGYEPQFTQAYRDYYIALDPLREYFENSPVGTMNLASQLANYDSILDSEFYNDYMLPQSRKYLAGATLARDGNFTIQFAIQRSPQAGDFGSEEMQLLRLLLPHLTRAVQLHRLIGETSARTDMAYASLDQARIGIFLMDDCGHILHINRAGEKLLSSGKISVFQQKLALTSPSATAQLHKLIASAAHPTLEQTLRSGGDMKLLSSEGHVDLKLCVTPLSGRDENINLSMPTGSVAVFVSRLGTLRLSWQRVATTYGLSPAEAKLAVIIAQGRSPDKAAKHLFISVHTARAQLKSIFTKTGTNRQTELVSLLLSGILAWCIEEG